MCPGKNFLRLLLSKHKNLTGEPGGSGSHGCGEANRIQSAVHIGRYSMRELENGQEEKSNNYGFLKKENRAW